MITTTTVAAVGAVEMQEEVDRVLFLVGGSRDQDLVRVLALVLGEIKEIMALRPISNFIL
jgi:hypothetical protein